MSVSRSRRVRSTSVGHARDNLVYRPPSRAGIDCVGLAYTLRDVCVVTVRGGQEIRNFVVVPLLSRVHCGLSWVRIAFNWAVGCADVCLGHQRTRSKCLWGGIV